MKLIIAGGRDFDDYEKLKLVCDTYLESVYSKSYLEALFKGVEIVSGTAKGADLMGERYAKERGYNVKRFPAEWNKYGKKAGYLRNFEMSQYGDSLIAFWDGKSKGTKLMIDLANQFSLDVEVVKY